MTDESLTTDGLSMPAVVRMVADQIRRGSYPKIAAPETELVEDLDLPLSTYHGEKAAGRGPRTFKIGRRNYILLADWQAWLESRAGEA